MDNDRLEKLGKKFDGLVSNGGVGAPKSRLDEIGAKFDSMVLQPPQPSHPPQPTQPAQPSQSASIQPFDVNVGQNIPAPATFPDGRPVSPYGEPVLVSDEDKQWHEEVQQFRDYGRTQYLLADSDTRARLDSATENLPPLQRDIYITNQFIQPSLNDVRGTAPEPGELNATATEFISPIIDVTARLPANLGISGRNLITGDDAPLIPSLAEALPPARSRGEALGRAGARLAGTVGSFLVPSAPLKAAQGASAVGANAAAKLASKVGASPLTTTLAQRAGGFGAGVSAFGAATQVPELLQGDVSPGQFAADTTLAAPRLAVDAVALPQRLLSQSQSEQGIASTPEGITETERIIEPVAAIALAGKLKTGEGPKRQPRPIKGLARGTRFYAEDLITAIEREGGPVGRAIGNRARKAVDTANSVQGKVEQKLVNFERRLRSLGPLSRITKEGRETQQARSELSEPVYDGDAGFSKLQIMVEGQPSPSGTSIKGASIRNPNPAEKSIADQYVDIGNTMFNEARANGVELVGKDGKVIQIGNNSTARKFRRSYTEEFQSHFRRKDAIYEKLIAELERLNDLPRKQVIEGLEESLGASAERTVGLETARAFRVHPDHLKVDGKDVRILETDPIRAIRSAVRNDADRIGFASQFEQRVRGEVVGGGQSKVDRMRLRFIRNGGNERTFNELVSALNNRPLAESPEVSSLLSVRGEKPNSVGDVARRGAHALDKTVETSMLSAAVIPNAPEVLGKVPAVGGAKRTLRSAVDLAKNPTERVEMLRDMGAVTSAVLDLKLQKGRGVEDAVAGITGVARRATLFEPVNEFNEKLAANTGRLLAEDFKQGKATARDVERLRILDFTEPQIKQIQNGTASAELYNAIPQRLTAFTQGSTLRKAQRSKFANSRLFRTLFRFQNYAQLTARSATKISTNLVDAFRSGDPKRIQAAAEIAGEFVGGSATAGGMSIYLMSLVAGRDTDRSDESLPEQLGKNLWVSVVGGPIASIANSIGDDQSVGDMLVNMSPHLRAVQKGKEIFGGEGKYAQMTLGEKSIEAMKSVTPAHRFAKGYLAAMGLQDREIETANSKYWRSQVGRAQRVKTFKKEDDRFRHHMREAYGHVRNGRIDDANVAIAEALSVSGHSMDDVRSSLDARKKIARLSPEEIDSLRTEIGEKHFGALQREEDLLNNFQWLPAKPAEFYRNLGELRRKKRSETITPIEAGYLRSHERSLTKLRKLRDLMDKAVTQEEREQIGQSIDKVFDALTEVGVPASQENNRGN